MLKQKDLEKAAEMLRGKIIETPVHYWDSPESQDLKTLGISPFMKLELFQHTGTFKARGALLNALALSADERSRGVTAVSAGNHAIATAWAAHQVGTSAKVVMLSSASKIRVEKCEAYGAEVIMCDDIHGAFDLVRQIEQDEGRTFIQPFEGGNVALGTGTIGLEMMAQIPNLDSVIIPIGGGGLISGISAAIKAMNPKIKVYGVEPEGAQSMTISLAKGEPSAIDSVKTIADSLGAPHAAPYSFSLVQQCVDDVVIISDDQMKDAMRKIFTGLKLAVEPAGAAATAALMGPLKEKVANQNVGVIVCGANIAVSDFCKIAHNDMA